MTTPSADTVRRLYTDYLNPDHLDRLHEIIGPDYTPGPGGRGPEAFATVMRGLRTAFPDIHYTVDNLVADGQRVAVRFSWTGTHTGPFRDYPISHRRVASTGTAFFEVHDQKIVAGTIDTDRLGFLLAIDAIPYKPSYGPPPARL